MNKFQWIIVGLIGLVAWLQYNLGFYAAIGAIILLAVIIIFALAAHHQRTTSETLIRHKEADNRALFAHLKILNQAMRTEHTTETRASQMAMHMTRQMAQAIKAQVEAKYAARYASSQNKQLLDNGGEDDEEYNPYIEADADHIQTIDADTDGW